MRVIFALNLEDGEQGGGSGGGGFDSHAPISTHLQTPSALAFVVAVSMQLKKSEGGEQREREGERVRVPGGLVGGSGANTGNSRQGSAALLNSLCNCQGGCENSTCW